MVESVRKILDRGIGTLTMSETQKRKKKNLSSFEKGKFGLEGPAHLLQGTRSGGGLEIWDFA